MRVKIFLSLITLLLYSCNQGGGSIVAENKMSALGGVDTVAMPPYFNVNLIPTCSKNLNESCHISQPVVRVFVGNKNYSGDGLENSVVQGFNISASLNKIENQLSNINRFRIETRDESIFSTNAQIDLWRMGAKEFAKKNDAEGGYQKQPDYLMRLDTVITVNVSGSITHTVEYVLDASVVVIDPRSRQILGYPNVRKVIVKSSDIRSKDQLSFIMSNNKHVSGFRYFDRSQVDGVLHDMLSLALDRMFASLKLQIPAIGEVTGIDAEKITIDRGVEAGIFPNENMILFSYHNDLIEPLALVRVEPGVGMSYGKIVRKGDGYLHDGAVYRGFRNRFFVVSTQRN